MLVNYNCTFLLYDGSFWFHSVVSQQIPLLKCLLGCPTKCFIAILSRCVLSFSLGAIMMLSGISSESCPVVWGGETSSVIQNLQCSVQGIRGTSKSRLKEHLRSVFFQALPKGVGRVQSACFIAPLDLRDIWCNGLASLQDSSCAVNFNGKQNFTVMFSNSFELRTFDMEATFDTATSLSWCWWFEQFSNISLAILKLCRGSEFALALGGRFFKDSKLQSMFLRFCFKWEEGHFPFKI